MRALAIFGGGCVAQYPHDAHILPGIPPQGNESDIDGEVVSVAARAGRNRRAANATIKSLEASGRIAAADLARVEMLRALADAVDACPDNAALWRQYREAEITLREAVEDDAGLAEFLAGLSAPMGDVEKR